MKRLLVTLTLSAVIAAASLSAMAQGAPPAAPGASIPRWQASEGTMGPGGSTASRALVPAPCITTAMRLVHPRMLGTLEQRLGLTPEQKVKVADLLNKAEKEDAELVLAQRQAAEEFVDTLAKPDATEAQITAAAKKFMDAETAMISAKAKTLVELRSTLTADQQQALTDMLVQYTSMWRARPDARPAAGAPAPPQGTVR